MNQSFEDLSPLLGNHTDDVESLMETLKPFHRAREETYQLSFAKRGEAGVWLNLARKYDRLDPLASRVMAQVVAGEDVENNDGVTLVDTLVDTAMYALKWLSIIEIIRPEHFTEWLEQVYCRDTGMDINEARVFFGHWGDVKKDWAGAHEIKGAESADDGTFHVEAVWSDDI